MKRKPRKLITGVCPHCHREVERRKDGSLRPHLRLPVMALCSGYRVFDGNGGRPLGAA